MKGIYLGAFLAYHPNYNIVYQDINGKRDLGGDMMNVDLSEYDFIICTPPCNYYSRANWRRNSSDYSLKTRHLLPGMLHKLSLLSKPFIVENVRSKKMFDELGLFDLPGIYVYFIGRHTYWTNIPLNPYVVDYLNNIQKPIIDFKNGKKRYLSSQNLPRNKRQGTKEVDLVIDNWLREVRYEIELFDEFN